MVDLPKTMVFFFSSHFFVFFPPFFPVSSRFIPFYLFIPVNSLNFHQEFGTYCLGLVVTGTGAVKLLEEKGDLMNKSINQSLNDIAVCSAAHDFAQYRTL